MLKFKQLLMKSGKRSVMLVSLLLLAMVTFAVPAKPGIKRLLTLTDGTTVSATLVGDEHAHYWLGTDGRAYQSAGDDVYQTIDLQAVKQRAAVRRSAANQRRVQRLAPKKVGTVGSITGDKKGIIILVNFKDKSFTATQSDFNKLANQVNYNSGNYKGSMYDYFYAQSDGQFRLTFDVVGPYTMSQNCSYYGGNDSEGNDEHPAKMVIEAIKLADADVNFADYDWDGDGTVDQVYVVYAGKGEADGGSDDTIWPHEYDLYSANYYGDGEGPQTLDGVTINTYACGGEQNGSTGATAGIGTMCHEFSHCLGYPDFYDTDYSGGQGMGYWDLMDSGSYNGDGYRPAGYTSYERWVAGWKTPTELVNTQSISNMAALQTTGSDTYIIYNKGNNNEYYLLENRQKTKWDTDLPGKGLLILHVDYSSSAWTNNTPNDDPSHQRMTWVAADNNYQYTTNSEGSKSYTFNGMKNDPFPYGNVNSFGKNTTPAATLYNNNSDGTKYLDSSIENITQNSDGTISFLFRGLSNVEIPTFSPNGGTYDYGSSVNVTISCGTSGASIYYTTDGTDPTTSSTQYTGALTFNTYTVLKAIAEKDGETSGVASATFKFNEPMIVADESLVFSTYTGTPQTKQLEVLSENLTQDITLTLNDANNVFSLGSYTISKDDEYATVDVVFTPTTAGTYTGTITLTSQGAPPVTVGLTATAKEPSSSNPNTTTFKLVSSVNDLEAGMRYIIGCGSAEKAAGTIGSGTFLSDVDITLSSNVITINNNVAVFVLEQTNDGWTFKNESTNQYLQSTSNKNVSYSSTAAAWTLSNGTAGVIMTAGGAGTMLYNTSSPRFTTYTSTPNTTMIQANLYMEYDDGTTPVTKQDVTMAFSPTSASATMGESFTAPTLTTDPDGLTVTYSSSNTNVATVNSSTGAVTLVAAGETTITATFAGNDSYNSGSASYTLTVSAASSGSSNEFALVTSASDFVEGDYIIVYDGVAMNTTVSSNRLQYTTVTPENNVITTDDATIIWHIAPSGNYYTIYNADVQKYAAATGSNNQAQLLANGTDDKALWSVTTGTTFDFQNKSNSRYLRRNGTYGFACYSSDTGGKLSLYKRTGGGGSQTTDYYQPADGKKGEALKTAMCGIIYNRTEKTYDYLWTAFQTTDVRSDGKVWDMYSNATNFTFGTDQAGTFSNEGEKYNREHSWPKSWFGGEVMPMYTDLHHMYPTDGFVNNKRANYPFGETNGTGQGSYQSNGGFSKLGACTYSGYTGTVFEPADEYKGDFARTYFYMVTCYEEKLHDWYTNYSSTDVVHVINGSTYPGFQTWQLNMLMKWAKNDPVSEKETARNNAVYAIQANRNPFIDYPGLQEYIWGICVDDNFSYDNYVEPVYKENVTMSFSPSTATATVGDDFTEPTLTTTPSSLTVSYSSSNTNAATVDASTGEVSLVAAGTTTITATFAGNESYNSGSASYTLTVSAAQALPATPTGLALSDVASTSMSASWSAVTDATSYDIDVVQGSSFEASAGEAVLQSNFSTTTGWTLSGTGTYTGAGYYGAGSPSIKFDTTGDYAISPDFGSGAKLQFWAYGNGGSGSTFAIKGLVNNVWTDIETVTIAQGGATYEVNLPTGTSQVRFNFTKSVNCALDDVVIYGASNNPISLDGYPKSIGNVTSYDITDLTAETQYAVRVRAVNGAGNSNWSSAVTATTTVGNVAPVTVPTLAVTESGITSTSAPVSWDACDGVSSYTLQLASDDEFTESSQGSQVTLINESFEDNAIPNTWLKSSTNISVTNGKSGDGNYCVAFKGTGAYLITPLVDNPNNVSFMYKRSSNTAAWSLNVSYATSTSGPWTNIGTVSSATTTWQTFSENLDNVGSVYIKFTDTRSTGSHERYIDLVQITSTSDPVVGSLISTNTVSSTSYTFTGLTPATTYYARVKGDDDWSNVVSFTTQNTQLNLANDGNNSSGIETAATNGGKYDVTLSDRTLYKDGDWNTLCLPFALNSLDGTPLEGATVKTLNSASFSGGTLTLNFSNDLTSLDAGTPYIVKWTEGTDITNPVFSGVTISNANSPVTIDNVITFQGITSSYAIAGEDKTKLFLGAGNTLYYPNAAMTIGACRAYFQLADGIIGGNSTNASDIKSFILNFGDGGADGISEYSEYSKYSEGWYDLSGRRIEGKPTSKGIYVNNGKKIIIK